ncbi:MAG: hypothetical protein IID44_03455 [Planctomycetes bacterium]|nr:hypothetical protein [Planctomycetota bacterium]
MNDSKVLELFGLSTRKNRPKSWPQIIKKQVCPFVDAKCFKVRKSQPNISIGTCAVRYGKDEKDVIICPNRLLERMQVFTDCLHLLTRHEPGNELHVVPEVSIPGGSVDYFLASTRDEKVRDFVAIEFQTLDTTGTVWPERERFRKAQGLKVKAADVNSTKSFGMNWKMTAKTILVQLHHKVDTLEHIGKRFVLVIQDHLLDYLQREFNFGHLKGVRSGDTMHIHAYRLVENRKQFQLQLDSRISTDAAGVAKCLGIQADTKVDLKVIVAELEKKISRQTLLSLGSL